MKEEKIKVLGQEFAIMISSLVPMGKVFFCRPEDAEIVKNGLLDAEKILKEIKKNENLNKKPKKSK